MSIKPTQWTPPWSYAGTRLSHASVGPQDLDWVVRRATAFSRESVLEMSCRILWHCYRTPSVRREPANAITRAYATILVAAACAEPVSDGPLLDITEVEFRLLCWELHNAQDCGSDTSTQQQHQRIARCLQQVSSASRLAAVRHAEPCDVYRHHIFSMLTEIQKGPFYAARSELIRPFLIYEHFRRRFRESSAFEAIERTVLKTSLHGLAQAFFVLTRLANRDASGVECPGLISVDPAGQQSIGALGEADVAALTQTLGQDLYDWSAINQPPTSGQFLRRLEERPLLTWQRDGTLTVAIPSPWHLRAGIARLLLDRLPAELERNGIAGYPHRGEAFDTYLGTVLAAGGTRSRLLRVPEVEGHRTPDFLWIGERHVVVIEAKNQLTPNSAPVRFLPTDGDPGTVIAAWQRAAEAIEQAHAFIERGCDGLHGVESPRYLLAIVAMESCAAEMTGFTRAARRWGFLQGTSIQALCVLSAAELEHAVLDGTADTWGAQLEYDWSFMNTGLPESFVADQLTERVTSPVIMDGMRRFFGGACVD